VSDSPTWNVKFTIPGLSLENYDRDGNPKMTSLMVKPIMALPYVYKQLSDEKNKTLMAWKGLTKDRLVFSASATFTMSRAVYCPEIPKWPLDVHFCIGYVGKSSLKTVANFCPSGRESEPLWTEVYHFVSVDNVTRKSKPWPGWFQDHFKGKGCAYKGHTVRPFERPSLTYNCPVKVRWSDIDYNNHSTFTSYVHWAINAIHATIREEDEAKGLKSTFGADQRPSSALNGINKDIITNGLKDVQICFLSESLEGQVLNVHVWQQHNLAHAVFTSIERDSEVICQIKFEYNSEP
ncbi:unnamed protein product, partial [Lymnaea stagnalis]